MSAENLTKLALKSMTFSDFHERTIETENKANHYTKQSQINLMDVARRSMTFESFHQQVKELPV